VAVKFCSFAGRNPARLAAKLEFSQQPTPFKVPGSLPFRLPGRSIHANDLISLPFSQEKKLNHKPAPWMTMTCTAESAVKREHIH
jgi:hypothetical protein